MFSLGGLDQDLLSQSIEQLLTLIFIWAIGSLGSLNYHYDEEQDYNFELSCTQFLLSKFLCVGRILEGPTMLAGCSFRILGFG